MDDSVPRRIANSRCVDAHGDGEHCPNRNAQWESGGIDETQKEQSKKQPEEHEGTDKPDPELQPIKGTITHFISWLYHEYPLPVLDV
ncbi:MAG: hypothetical protein MUF13_13740 [Akkermansiaceae bacterium]|nr:hypothetical protein [Akkermansiaceae bacterium]